jgi:hypothetical protein
MTTKDKIKRYEESIALQKNEIIEHTEVMKFMQRELKKLKDKIV